MLGMNETMDQMAIVNSVRWYDYYVLKRGDGHVLRRALDIEAEGQWKREAEKYMKESGWWRKC